MEPYLPAAPRALNFLVARAAFHDQMRPAFDSIQAFARRSANLRQARGLLLLKLVSGELDADEVEISE